MADLITPQFNEGGPSGLGWSELAPLSQCEKEFQLAQVRQIYKPTSQSPDYFAEGSFVHAGRARWFAEKQSTSAETWQLVVKDVDRLRESLPLPCSDTAVRNALRYLTEYIEHYSVRPKPNIAAVEHLLGPFQLEGDSSERTARLDDWGFYPEVGGALAIGECKTTSSLTDTLNEYTLHGQPVLQRLLWDIAPQGAATYGAAKAHVLDVIQKGYGGKKCEFLRVPMIIPDRVLTWGKATIVKLLKRRAEIGWNTETDRRLSACTRPAGRARVACQFQNLCMYGKDAALDFAFRDGTSLADFQPSEGRDTAPWD